MYQTEPLTVLDISWLLVTKGTNKWVGEALFLFIYLRNKRSAAPRAWFPITHFTQCRPILQIGNNWNFHLSSPSNSSTGPAFALSASHVSYSFWTDRRKAHIYRSRGDPFYRQVQTKEDREGLIHSSGFNLHPQLTLKGRGAVLGWVYFREPAEGITLSDFFPWRACADWEVKGQRSPQ